MDGSLDLFPHVLAYNQPLFNKITPTFIIIEKGNLANKK
jgi:hypothetical protein